MTVAVVVADAAEHTNRIEKSSSDNDHFGLILVFTIYNIIFVTVCIEFDSSSFCTMQTVCVCKCLS